MRRACRAAVKKRDKGRCVIPGCKEAAQHMHHIVYRSHGGKWHSENICSLCVTHHQLVHAGLIQIAGNADVHLDITGDLKHLRFKP
jgi:5-methylcytosine-specific restriction endonuclease McrA